MAAQTRATFTVAFMFISFSLFIIALQFSSFWFLNDTLHLCGLIGLYFFIGEILQAICNVKRADIADVFTALTKRSKGR